MKERNPTAIIEDCRGVVVTVGGKDVVNATASYTPDYRQKKAEKKIKQVQSFQKCFLEKQIGTNITENFGERRVVEVEVEP